MAQVVTCHPIAVRVLSERQVFGPAWLVCFRYGELYLLLYPLWQSSEGSMNGGCSRFACAATELRPAGFGWRLSANRPRHR